MAMSPDGRLLAAIATLLQLNERFYGGLRI